jgi:CHAD domain-containing protein
MAANATFAGTNPGVELLELLEGVDLTQTKLEPEAVHRIRVAIKQSRAWLKLCRGVTGKSEGYRQLISDLRALSGRLAGQRDRDVALQTLVKLARKHPGKKAQHLVEILSQHWRDLPLTPALETRAHTSLVQIRNGLQAFAQLQIPPTTQVRVVERTYAKMCKTGEAALKSETCSELHAWRKLVKTVGYQLAMLESCTAHRKKLIAHLTRLGSKLGKLHDLCFLQGMITDSIGELEQELDLAPLSKRITKEYKVLIEAAHKLYLLVCRHPPQLSTGDAG